MKQLITITDLTRMAEQRVCIAGYTPEHTCIRPLLPHGHHLREDCLCKDGQVVMRPFGLVEFDLQEHLGRPPHTEDWIVEPDRFVLRRVLTLAEKREMLEKTLDGSVGGIFGAQVHTQPGWYVMAGEGKRSLGTIIPRRIDGIHFYEDKGSYQLSFHDLAGAWYRLTVVDLDFRALARRIFLTTGTPPQLIARDLTAKLRIRRVYLRIGLSRGWREHPDKCFLQITGVHTFPDYLEGRCFADFDHA